MAKQDTYEFEYEGIVVNLKVRKEINRLEDEIAFAETRVNNANRDIILLIEKRKGLPKDAVYVEQVLYPLTCVRDFWQNTVDENNDAIAALLAAYGRD